MRLDELSRVAKEPLSEEHVEEAEKRHVSVVIAGHIAGDNLGVNLVLDAIGKQGGLEVIGTSGSKRVKRT